MRKLKVEELNRLTTLEFKAARKVSLVIVLDNLRSQNNIGSVFRTCDAFLVKKLYLCGITATPPHKEIHKTTLGATESVEWEYSESTIKVVRDLKERGYIVLAAEQTDKSIYLQDYPVDNRNKYAIVLGHEMHGVDQKVIDECMACIEIPQHGTKHSLNVAVSGGILIWHFFRRLYNNG